MDKQGAFWRLWMLAALLCAGRTLGAVPAPVVTLDARDPSAGTAVWYNDGALGDFSMVGQPRVQEIAGARAVMFNGVNDAYRGPLPGPMLTGSAPRTIEVWAFNPTLDSDEETMVSWGRRGGSSGSMLAFGWGRSPVYGAVTHWGDDLGWSGIPSAGHWHFLTYTYDGKMAAIYDDGVLKGSRAIPLNTTADSPITLGAETGADGATQFLNEFTYAQLAGSLALASVKIFPAALPQAQIAADFQADAQRFGATTADAEGALGQGVERLAAGPLTLTLLRANENAASLSPAGTALDFLPGDHLAGRAFDGFNQLGDITLMTRSGKASWASFSSAAGAEAEVTPLTLPGTLAAADITNMLGPSCPLRVVRIWRQGGDALVLRFQLTNRTAHPIEIGALGAPMVFNNILTGRTLDEAHDKCSFSDPYIGGPGGFLRVARLNGQGPALLVTPEAGTSFEGYEPLRDDPTPRGVTFEGFYAWMAHTRALADGEWRGAQPWCPPTSRLVPPGGTVTYGFRFFLAPSIPAIEPTLTLHGRPVAVGIPGYVLPTDQMGRLFVKSAQSIRSITVQPAGALQITPDAHPTAHGWRGFIVRGVRTGRCRVTVAYAGGLKQFISYNVLLPEAQQVAHLGRFLATREWFDDPSDPFYRTDSFMPYDRERNQIVLQRENSWAVGLSDEMGAGASVAMAMKNLEMPDPAQIALLEKYVSTALWGHVQNPDFSVRASLFYYDPKALPSYHYTVHGGWDKPRSETTWRAYNYPHVTCVYWALYHLARDHQGLIHEQTWQWYLDHAFETAMAMQKSASGQDQFGLMVGSVFPALLADLRREGWNAQADRLEAYMHTRERHWASLRYPFGSEMPWDSTGQEEIYTWCRYFGDLGKAQTTMQAITAYVSEVPNWAYSGAARRYFDESVNNTRWPDIMRITNHYGSGLNAIPVLDAFKRDPRNVDLLRIGYAGMDQLLANIDVQGFGSGDFDCDPAILQFDPFTSDYGIGFFGYARNAGTYAIHHPEFGWLAFGGDVAQAADGQVIVTPRDGFRKRVFLAPLGLWLTLDAGSFARVAFNAATGKVQITLDRAVPGTRTALLRIGQLDDGNLAATARPLTPLALVRGAYTIPLAAHTASVTLQATRENK